MYCLYWKLLLTVIFESISFTVIYVLSNLLFATFIFLLTILLVYMEDFITWKESLMPWFEKNHSAESSMSIGATNSSI
jgi:hypothetical protein